MAKLNVSRTFSKHGLLIDKYLNRTMAVKENAPSPLFSWTTLFLVVLVMIVLFENRSSLVKAFRERHKRSVLKYSV